MKITFIGGGNMGEAMLAAVLNKKIAKRGEITVSDVSEERLKYLNDKYKTYTRSKNREALNGSDVIVLAIKPQKLAAVMADLHGLIRPQQLMLSIIAGARIDTLRQGFGHKAIVRSMPNTPAQIGEGVTVWTTTPEVTEKQKQIAGSILGAMGKQIYVDDEKYLDMATAVSGSGPAYVFLFVEALIGAAVEIGWSPEVAKELAMGTVLGASHLLQQSGKEASELRRAVTSPGGTTAEAIRVFEEGDFRGLVAKAVKAAHEKAMTLGKG